MTDKIIFILGETVDGQRFRPSDWAERVASCCASFSMNKRLKWHNMLRPVYVNNRKCLVINTVLRDIEPSAWEYLLGFVNMNHLKISESDMARQLDSNELTQYRAA